MGFGPWLGKGRGMGGLAQRSVVLRVKVGVNPSILLVLIGILVLIVKVRFRNRILGVKVRFRVRNQVLWVKVRFRVRNMVKC